MRKINGLSMAERELAVGALLDIKTARWIEYIDGLEDESDVPDEYQDAVAQLASNLILAGVDPMAGQLYIQAIATLCDEALLWVIEHVGESPFTGLPEVPESPANDDSVSPHTFLKSVTLGGTEYKNVRMEVGTYVTDPDTMSIQLYWTDDLYEEPLATASVNLPGNPPMKGCAWIKDYSENEGMIDSLVAEGIIQMTGRSADAGFEMVYEAKLLIP